ncbi:MAG TPA: molybdenum cofactor guanylyltransferase [Ktedonobacteraceae bacterium]|nr:molybdenum cofactor guanylyltransferase [Ktedonobacteraceae bacterium]
MSITRAEQFVQTACIILAGGHSRRMGTDKALLPLTHASSSTFLAHLVTALSSLCDELLLVARDEEQATRYKVAASTIRIVTDKVPDSGPLMGISSGLSAIQAAKALVVAVDMPFAQPALVAWLLARASTTAITVPVVNDIPQVLFAVYPRSILPQIETNIAQGRRDPRSLLTSAPVQYIDEAQLRGVDPQLRSFININTPEEWRENL